MKKLLRKDLPIQKEIKMLKGREYSKLQDTAKAI